MVHLTTANSGAIVGQASAEIASHTPTPWFVSGVRFRMNGGEWQSINRYDESKKQDENIACVGYDSRTGIGFADAKFIVKAVNSHQALLARVAALEADLNECREFIENYVDVNDGDYGEPAPNRAMSLVSMIDETLNGRPY